jgi:hypothetical protein
MLAGLIVAALMLFCVIALAFTARMDRVLARSADSLQTTDFDGTGPLPELEAFPN